MLSAKVSLNIKPHSEIEVSEVRMVDLETQNQGMRDCTYSLSSELISAKVKIQVTSASTIPHCFDQVFHHWKRADLNQGT